LAGPKRQWSTSLNGVLGKAFGPKGLSHRGLLADPQVRRWYENTKRGSRVTADVHLRRLGWLCRRCGLSPTDLRAMNPSDIYNLLVDLVTEMEAEGHAGGYIQSVVKAVKSWLSFNNLDLGKRKIKVTDPMDTPTLKDEKAPEPEQLRKAFEHADTRTKAVMALSAFAGVRPEVLGDYMGDDGLRVRDLPEIQIDNENRRVWFSQVPTKVIVRKELSKAGHQYFSLLCEEGCRYVSDELERRLRLGQKLTSDSPIIASISARRLGHITTKAVSADIRYAFRKAGFNWRPYILRVYFDTRMLLAEANTPGFLRDYRVFLMGHKGDIEHVYTLNKCSLPSSLEESIRSSFERTLRFLETMPRLDDEVNQLKELRELILLAAGYTDEEIAEMTLEDLTTEELKEKLQARLADSPYGRTCMVPSGSCVDEGQKIVDCGEAEKLVNSGRYVFVGSLPNGNVAIKRIS